MLSLIVFLSIMNIFQILTIIILLYAYKKLNRKFFNYRTEYPKFIKIKDIWDLK